MSQLKLLLVEDSEQDGELVLREFRRAGIDVRSQRIWSATSLKECLREEWDAILCDFNMPGFDATQALAIVRNGGFDLPFIIVSGVIGEETAVAAMRAGAHDYLLKGKLSRLVPVVEREMKEAASRKARRDAEESLRLALVSLKKSESRFKRLAEASELGIVIAGFNGELHEVNDAFLRMIDRTRTQFEAGIRWNEITPEKYSDIEKRRIEEMKRRGACTPYEKEYFRLDGSLVPVLIGYAILEDEEDRCICFVADLTERKKIELELEQAVIARDEFMSIASHELKTPLTSLMLQMQLASRILEKSDMIGGPSVTKFIQVLSTSLRQVTRLTSLIDDLLDATRASIGKLSINLESFDLSELVGEIYSRFSDQLEVSGNVVELDVPQPFPVILDRHRVDQVLANLFSNAIKYAPRSLIQLSVVSNNDKFHIMVKDGGPGLAAKDLTRVFERFERVGEGSNVKGLGLGLYIVRQIVETHGGRIWVESEIGLGASFFVEFPRLEITDPIATK